MPKTSNILNTVAIEGFPFFLSISLTVAKPTPAISARSNCDISRVFLRLFNTSLSSISPINHTFDVKIYIISRNYKKKYNILDFFRKNYNSKFQQIPLTIISNNLHLRISKSTLTINKLHKNQKARLPEKTGNPAFTLFANSL